MSCVEYKKDVEFDESTCGQERGIETPKPFLVPNRQARLGNQVADRVAAVLDFELARGSMPA